MENILLAEATGYIAIGVIIVLLIAFFVWSFLSQKKRQKAFNDTVNAIRPGNKVKTIGGIIGEVVEVNEEEGTFVIKTGLDDSNCSYMKFDRQAIYQTDAKPEAAAEVKEQPAETPAEEAKAEETPVAEQPAAEAVKEEAAPAEESAPAAEVPAEEAKAEESAQKPARKPAKKSADKAE